MNTALWIVQVLLAALFLFAGSAKLVMTPEQLSSAIPFPVWFLRFIACCEILGALGLLLPGIFKIRRGLTPLAAGGLVIIMIGATATSLWMGMIWAALLPAATGILAGFVVYGRLHTA